jgi:hypothetical protein
MSFPFSSVYTPYFYLYCKVHVNFVVSSTAARLRLCLSLTFSGEICVKSTLLLGLQLVITAPISSFCDWTFIRWITENRERMIGLCASCSGVSELECLPADWLSRLKVFMIFLNSPLKFSKLFVEMCLTVFHSRSLESVYHSHDVPAFHRYIT